MVSDLVKVVADDYDNRNADDFPVGETITMRLEEVLVIKRFTIHA
jgi:hypothetical protein